MENFDLKIEYPDPKLLPSRIAEKIRELITLGKLKPGERLKENKLAESSNLSRQPIREALRILELENLITIIPRKGAYVSEISLKEIEEIYEIRAMIDGYAARLAVPSITRQDLDELDEVVDLMGEAVREDDFEKLIKQNLSFHQKIITLSKNDTLVKLYESVLLPVRRYQRMGLSLHSSWLVSLEEHRDILEALTSGDIEQVERVCREHALGAEKRLVDRLVSNRAEGDKEK
jgi:DNA-binding GntR family transcriptional regulator